MKLLSGVRERPLLLLSAIVAFCMLSSSSWQPVRGEITSCQASVDSHVLATSSTNELIFHVENTDTVAFSYIKINVSSADYSIIAGALDGWSVSPGDSFMEVLGSTLNPGESINIVATVTAAANEVPAANWSVQVSEGSSGLEAYTCSGDTSISIDNGAVPPQISAIAVTNITTTAARVSWVTDVPATTKLDYGTTSAYGQSANVSDLTTTHTIELSNLSPNTNYYFRVSSQEIEAAVAEVEGNTFLTKSETAITATSAPRNVTTSQSGSSVSFTKSWQGVYADFPQITGTIKGTKRILAVDYSVDGGANWLPAVISTGAGSSTAAFAFKPIVLKDGNYEVVVRAKDDTTVIATSESFSVVIDRDKPSVSGVTMYSGVLDLSSANGHAEAIIGVPITINGHVEGGATEVSVQAKYAGSTKTQQSFTLTYVAETGLWRGLLSFTQPGDFTLYVLAKDGAANSVQREFSNISVKPLGTVVNRKGQSITAKVEVFEKDMDDQSWVQWDGAAFKQANPVTTTVRGSYSYYLPANTYHLRISAKGYQTVITDSFTLDAPAAIGSKISLPTGVGVRIGSVDIRTFWPAHLAADHLHAKKSVTEAPQLVKDVVLPTTSLQASDGTTVSYKNLIGKPSLIVFGATWVPAGEAQLQQLSKLTTGGLHAYYVLAGENVAVAKLTARQNSTPVVVLADKDNTWSSSFKVGALPTTYFIDRHGTVKAMLSGLVTKEELLSNVQF